MPIVIVDNFDVNVGKNIDSRYGPYASADEATGSIASIFRYKGLTVLVTGSGENLEYWFDPTIADTDLVLKTASVETGSFVTTSSFNSWTGSGTFGGTASLAVITASLSGNDLTFTKGNGNQFTLVIPGVGGPGGQGIELELQGNNLLLTSASSTLSTVQIYPASSSISSSNADTASFVTASNVWGPYGSSSVVSASHAVTASYISGSFRLTAGGSNTHIQFNSASLFSGSTNLAFDYINNNVILTGSLLVTKSHISTVDYIDFTKIPTGSEPAHLEGRLHWYDDTKTLQIDTDKNNFMIEVGHQNVVRVYNDTGADIGLGKVVRISGSQGNQPKIVTASWIDDSSSASTLGFAATLIAGSGGNRHGYVITNGVLRNVDTSAHTVGTQLYLSTSGDFTNTPPDAPLHEVRLGKVIVQNSTTGVIYVDVMNGYELTELHDVKTTTYKAGDLLIQSGGLWINSKQLTGSYGLTGSLNVSGAISASLGPNTVGFYGTASWAVTASHAITSSYVLSASYATSASYVLSSSYATTASFVTSASYATSASYVLSSSYATSASFVLSSSYATTASYVLSSSFATTASYVLSSSYATTASFVTSASYATTASFVVSASYATSASQALSASYVLSSSFATTASFVLSSSFATTASYVLSSSYATTASYVLSASYADTASAILVVNTDDTVPDGDESLHLVLAYTGSETGVKELQVDTGLRYKPLNNFLYVPSNGALIIGNTTFQSTEATFGSADAQNNVIYLTGSLNVSKSINVDGRVQISGPLNTTGSVRHLGLNTSPTAVDVLTYNSSTGEVFYTASSAIGGGSSGPSGAPGGLDSQIQFNSGSQLSGSANFTFDYSGSINVIRLTGSLLVSGAISAAPYDTYIQFNSGGLLHGTSSLTYNYSQSILVLTGSLVVTQNITSSRALISSSGGNQLTVMGSGSSAAIAQVFGSQGNLITINDSLSGSLLTVSDISGYPILDVVSDESVLIGNYQAPARYTSAKITTINGINTVYSMLTSSYNGAFFDYTLVESTNARAGQIMSIWNGSTIRYTETTTTDIGSTSDFTFSVALGGGSASLRCTTTTAGAIIKTIIKGI